MKAVVLEDWNRFFPDSPALAALRERIDVEVFHDVLNDRTEIARRLQGANIVVLNRERTKFDAELIAMLPDLELIVQTGGVSPNVDVEAASDRGVAASGAPGLPNSIEGVAELALGLLISLARNIPANDRAVRAGRWDVQPTAMLNGGTAAIVGLGRLGLSLARMSAALQMHVIAAGPTLTPERAADSGVEFSTLDDLFPRADVVYICPRLSDLTRGMVTRAHIDSMKPTAYLVNAARGPIVDEDALLDALRDRRIAGAGLDVFGREPIPEGHPLLTLDNVVLTPHIGWVMEHNVARFVEMVAKNIGRYLDGDYNTIVNPRAFEVRRARLK